MLQIVTLLMSRFHLMYPDSYELRSLYYPKNNKWILEGKREAPYTQPAV